jgi:hypothetical protein
MNKKHLAQLRSSYVMPKIGKNMGVNKVKWFESYLTGRKELVSLCGTKSEQSHKLAMFHRETSWDLCFS